MTTKLEQAARQVDKTAMRVEQDCEEALGEDGMVMVVPLDAYNDMMEAITALREALEHSGEADEMVAMNLNCKSVQARLATLWGYVKAEQAEQDLDTCPGCGGVADNGHDREFPPNPYYCTKCTEQAEQEPVSMFEWQNGNPVGLRKAAPVRTKDLTDDEISDVFDSVGSWKETLFGDLPVTFARAVIAADRENNK